MVSLEELTLSLIDAVPPNGDLSQFELHAGCSLAFDASGTRTAHFEAAALNQGVAEALRDGRRHVSGDTAKQLTHEAKLNDPIRMGEYAGCLLTRARGNCLFYNAKTGQERTAEEVDDYFETWRKQHAG